MQASTARHWWTQFEEFPHFMAGVDRIEELGDTHTRRRIGGGPSRQFGATITEQHPDERVAPTSDDETRHHRVITSGWLNHITMRVSGRIGGNAQEFLDHVVVKAGVVVRRTKGDMRRWRSSSLAAAAKLPSVAATWTVATVDRSAAPPSARQRIADTKNPNASHLAVNPIFVDTQ